MKNEAAFQNPNTYILQRCVDIKLDSSPHRK
jgi:hypothetical protein